MTTRIDPHATSKIVPEDYSLVFSYAKSRVIDGWPEPSFRFNCQIDRRTETKASDGTVTIVNGEHDADSRCCIVGLRASGAKMADHGGPGKCTVCGAHFNDGDVWLHKPTGEHIHVGHDCAEKYNLLTEVDGEYDAFRADRTANRAAYRIRNAKEQARVDFLAANPGLEEDLKVDHRIVRDIAERFAEYGQLSDKQVALVHKLAAEVRNPPAAEQHVAAPEGRVTVRGRVVSTKLHDGHFGSSMKMTVKVETPEGSWLAWGTAPAALLGDAPLKGAEVEFTATLKRGRDAHFALAGRPTKARIVAPALAA